jgi:hypothetical protein
MTGRVLADLACAIADGAEVISDFRVMGDQEELFGLVASVPAGAGLLGQLAQQLRIGRRLLRAILALLVRHVCH